MKLNTVNQSSVAMETSPNASYETSKKDEGQFYEMLSLDLEN